MDVYNNIFIFMHNRGMCIQISWLKQDYYFIFDN